nr:putative SCAN domain-containing protein SCAND2P [Equus caballus]
MSVDIIQPVGGLKRTKNAEQGEFTLSIIFELRHQSSPAFRLGPKLTPSALLALRPLDLDWNYIIGAPGSPACPRQILGFLSLHNHMSQFLTIFLLILFPWRTQTNTGPSPNPPNQNSAQPTFPTARPGASPRSDSAPQVPAPRGGAQPARQVQAPPRPLRSRGGGRRERDARAGAAAGTLACRALGAPVQPAPSPRPEAPRRPGRALRPAPGQWWRRERRMKVKGKHGRKLAEGFVLMSREVKKSLEVQRASHWLFIMGRRREQVRRAQLLKILLPK